MSLQFCQSSIKWLLKAFLFFYSPQRWVCLLIIERLHENTTLCQKCLVYLLTLLICSIAGNCKCLEREARHVLKPLSLFLALQSDGHSISSAFSPPSTDSAWAMTGYSAWVMPGYYSLSGAWSWQMLPEKSSCRSLVHFLVLLSLVF